MASLRFWASGPYLKLPRRTYPDLGKLDSDLFIRDIAAMFILTVVLAIMLFGPKRVKLTRTKGALLLILFGLYQYFIYLDIAG